MIADVHSAAQHGAQEAMFKELGQFITSNRIFDSLRQSPGEPHHGFHPRVMWQDFANHHRERLEIEWLVVRAML